MKRLSTIVRPPQGRDCTRSRLERRPQRAHRGCVPSKEILRALGGLLETGAI